MMRILTGRLRGLSVIYRPNRFLRPTPDKVRKAIFQILGAKIRGAAVLDIFSGTGALGMEALSMGAHEVTFIEKDRTLCLHIKRMLDRYSLSAHSKLYRSDAWKTIESLHKQRQRFDIILADPPYEKGMAQRLLTVLKSHPLLQDDGWMIIETYKNESMPEKCGDLIKRRLTCYGDTAVWYYG